MIGPVSADEAGIANLAPDGVFTLTRSTTKRSKAGVSSVPATAADQMKDAPVTELSPATRIGPSPVHGNGVFATRDIRKGEVIDRCPCIVLEDGWQRIQTVLHDYLYCWPKDGDGRAIVLGNGSVFNHDAKANADWVTDEAGRQCIYSATRDIKAGEEIFINYGQDYWEVEHANAQVGRIPLPQLLALHAVNVFLD